MDGSVQSSVATSPERPELPRPRVRRGRDGGPPLVSFILFQVPTCGDEWLPEMPFSQCAGELQREGIRTEVVHVLLDAQSPEEWQRDEDALLAHLARVDTGIVVFDQLPGAGIAGRLRSEVGAVLVDADPWGGGRDAPPDYALRHLNTHRRALTWLCLKLARGESIDDVPNVDIWLGDRFVATAAGRQLIAFAESGDYVPRRDHVFFPPEYRPIMRQRALQSSTGCPYMFQFARNPDYEGVDTSNTAVSGGCAFCTIGGRYEALDNAQSVAFVVDQVTAIRRVEPEADQIFLSDQMPLRYLEPLVEALVAHKLLPLRLMLSTRADWIVQYGPQITRSAAQMAEAGGQLGFYLSGFESFSAPLARVYNKTQRPERWGETCKAAIELLYGLRRKHGEAFVLNPGATSFIIQSPWTTLETMRTDADYIDELGVGAMANEAPFSKLRLYTNVPLTNKAHKDGLTLQAHAELSAVGYAPVVPWRFSDARAERVSDVIAAQRDALQPREWPGLLRAGVGLVERECRGEVPERTPTAIRAELDSVLALRRVAPEVAADEAFFEVARGCNNHCFGCTARHSPPHDIDADTIASGILRGGRPPRRVQLGGHEPTLLPDLPQLIRLLREGGVDEVGVTSNGRRFALPAYARSVVKAGLGRAVLKWAGADAETHDTYTRTADSFEQMLRGAQNLRMYAGQAGQPLHLELLVVAHHAHLATLHRAIEAAQLLGATGLRLSVPPSTLDLAGLPHVREVLARLLHDAAAAGLVAESGLPT